MLFNSYEFLFLFLPTVLLGYYLLSSRRLTTAAAAWLVGASVVFYGYWSMAYVPLLLASIAGNYAVGRRLGQRPDRRLLALAIAANLLALGYYKYADFLLATFAQVAGLAVAPIGVTLPLGISFFTFTQIAYLVDANRGEAKDSGLTRYALFVTFFPHLIAGPILHHASTLPQFERARAFVFSSKNLALGLAFLAIGLVKKIVVADNLARWATPVFAAPADATAIDAWFGLLGYTFQLYFDFSGYSDMAVGLALMLNIRIPYNFDSPYQATSIIDFWRRWHISLSAFLRDYVYIPLGGNRHGEPRRYLNLFLTMLLGGIWHGAGWTFVVWGALHGSYLLVNHAWRRTGLALLRPDACLLNNGAEGLEWTECRAASVGDAVQLLGKLADVRALAGGTHLLPYAAGTHLGLALLLFAIVLLLPNSQAIVTRMIPSRQLGVAFGLAAVLAIVSITQASEFLYYNF